MIVQRLHPSLMAGFVADPRMRFTPGPTYDWAEVADKGLAYAISDNDGAVIGAAGLYRFDDARPTHAEMWALFSADAGRFMAGVTRRTLDVLDASRGTLDRIQAHVDRAFPQARRWVLLLGFQPDVQSDVPDGFERFVWTG